MSKRQNGKLCDCVEHSLREYFSDLNGDEASGLYQMVLTEMEKPLLAMVMQHADRNQSRASKMLGINRNTLRKKLLQYGIGE